MLVSTSKGYIQFKEHYNHKLICLRTELVSQMPCAIAGTWHITAIARGSTIESNSKPGWCLERGVYSGDVPKLRLCNASQPHQTWVHEKGADGAGTLSGPTHATCLDNMQRKSGPPGLYACHGYGTQRWRLLPNGKVKTKGGDTCLDLDPIPGLFPCLPNDIDYTWTQDGDLLRSGLVPTVCLNRKGDHPMVLTLAVCDAGNSAQRWSRDN
jgi:hypothetical protein